MLKVKICLVIISLVFVAGFQTIGEEYVNIIQVYEQGYSYQNLLEVSSNLTAIR
jgi:hypothetical protein